MTEATLNLDARQRAMLDEMGVKVWWPTAASAAAIEATPAAESPVAAIKTIAAPAEPATAAVRLDSKTASVPKAVVPVAPAVPAAKLPARGVAAVLMDTPQRLYGTAGTEGEVTGGWLVVADMPPEADGRHGEPFAGDAGRLLDNMLRALRLHTGEAPVHLVRTHRAAAGAQAQSAHFFAEAFATHAAALAPRIVLAMGPLAAQSLLQSADPLGRLRGRAVPLSGLAGLAETPLVVTYHPSYLLRNPADKGRAWADLCLAAATLESTPS